MENLKYKDYLGSIEFSAFDKVFFGKIVGIDDLVTYEGNSIESIKKEFRFAVDDYLETCLNSNKTTSFQTKL